MSWNHRAKHALTDTTARLWGETDPNLPRPERLKALARSLVAMAQELEAAIDPRESGEQGVTFPALAPRKAGSEPGDLALKAYRDRRRRAEVFGDDTLFGEPAWDILLDLFAAGERGKRVAVTSACIGSGVPSTTALRWLNVLEARGLVEREEDLSDARRSFVRLTGKAKVLMAEYFAG